MGFLGISGASAFWVNCRKNARIAAAAAASAGLNLEFIVI